MTTAYQDMVNASVLMLVDLPLDERPEMMTKIGVEFEDFLEEKWPTLPREWVINKGQLFTVDILSRVHEINLTSGLAVGRA